MRGGRERENVWLGKEKKKQKRKEKRRMPTWEKGNIYFRDRVGGKFVTLAEKGVSEGKADLLLSKLYSEIRRKN